MTTGMTEKEWKELIELAKDEEANLRRFGDLIELTMLEEEHPEDYDGPCLCQLCQSYGD